MFFHKQSVVFSSVLNGALIGFYSYHLGTYTDTNINAPFFFLCPSVSLLATGIHNQNQMGYGNACQQKSCQQNKKKDSPFIGGISAGPMGIGPGPSPIGN